MTEELKSGQAADIEKLISRMASGDKEALAAFYQATKGPVYALAMSVLGERHGAEDIMQEVFLKLWYMRGELDYYNNVMALSVQITKHLCLNRMKVRERTEGEAGEQFFICDASTPYTQLEQKDSLEHVMRLINKLPGLQQTILRMKHVDGFEVEEIAGLTGSTPEAVRMNLSRARKRVREQFFKMQTL